MDSLFTFAKTIVTAAVITILLYSRFVKTKKRRASIGKMTAPEPPGAWPVIGHLHRVMSGRDVPLHRTLGSIADNYGPIFTLQMGVNKTLVVSNSEIAKELFTTNDKAISSRPPMVALKHLSYNNLMFAFAPFGDYWREMRKITSFELLSASRLDSLKNVRINEVEILVKELFMFWRDHKNESGSVVIEVNKWFLDFSLNNILRMIAGKRYFGGGGKCDDEEARRLRVALKDFFHYLGMLVMRDALPFLGWLDIGGHEKAMKRVAKELDTIISQWLDEHKQNRAQGEAKEELDFMDVMLSILDGKDLVGYDADTVHKATSLSMIAGASDTTLLTMIWTLSLLLNHLSVLKKVQQELDTCIGRENLVKDTDISKLVYLQAVVKETLRLHPPAPLAGSRLVIEDCNIGGYHVPKGTWIMVNQWKIQTDPNVWPNPLEFDPERFLTTHQDVDVKGQNYELIPFGSGRRICPGAHFALQMAHLTVASLLQAFEFSTPCNEPVDLSEKPGFTTHQATALQVLIKPRLPPNLYAH